MNEASVTNYLELSALLLDKLHSFNNCEQQRNNRSRKGKNHTKAAAMSTAVHVSKRTNEHAKKPVNQHASNDDKEIKSANQNM